MHLLKIDKENYIGQADPFFLNQEEGIIYTPPVTTVCMLIIQMIYLRDGSLPAE